MPHNIDLSLDDIIAKSKANKSSFGKKRSSKPQNSVRTSGKTEMRRGNGDGRKGGALSQSVPSGKWKRDLYAAEESALSTGKWKRDLFSAEESRDSSDSATANKKVRVNISNLAPTVTTSDLEELFSPYSPISTVVHYGEDRIHLGTGEVSMKMKDAQRALRDLKGCAVDGSLLTLAIVDGGSIFDRVQIVKKVDGGRIQKRSSKPQFVARQKSAKSNGGRHPLDRTDEENTNTKPNRGKGGKREHKPTEEELDAELDSYMKK